MIVTSTVRYFVPIHQRNDWVLNVATFADWFLAIGLLFAGIWGMQYISLSYGTARLCFGAGIIATAIMVLQCCRFRNGQVERNRTFY